MAMNLVVLTGRLTANPELKVTPNGVNVCSFDMAVDSGYGDNKQTNFFKIVTWRKTAELVVSYCRKGSLIGVEGSLQTRKYQDKDGNNRVAFEIVANNIQFLESKKSETEVDPLEQFNATVNEDNGDLPF